MKKVGDLMKELGFREDASDDVKRAFVRNLMRAAYGVEIPVSKTNGRRRKAAAPRPAVQLSFDLSESEAKPDPVLALFPRRKPGP